MALFGVEDLQPARSNQPKRKGEAIDTPSPTTRLKLVRARVRVGQAIGRLVAGRTIHYATAADWSTHDLALYLIEQVGPADVLVATWSISEPAVRHAVCALLDGRFTRLRMLIDWRTRTRCPEALQLATANAAQLRTASVHAKVTILRNAQWAVTIIGSANWTNNPRIEAGVVSTDPSVADFHTRWLEQELAGAAPFEAPADTPQPP